MRNIPFGSPMLGKEEKEAVIGILNGSVLVHGPKVKEFESKFSEYIKAPYALAVSSCTAALHLSYFYLGIGTGDEVIVPAQTHVATAHAVELTGAKPVFVDAERQTGNIDISLIENRLSEKTKAISIVHYLGMPVDMDGINKIARKHRLFVVEDCALAMGTYFKGIHAGLHGDAGCFSFYPVKHMTTAEGGMLVSKHKEVTEKIGRQRAFGVDRHVGERKVPGMYDVDMLGLNYRMNEIEAAIGLGQIGRMDSFLKRRKENYDTLSANLREMDEIRQFVSTNGDYQSSYYCLSVILEKEASKKRLDIINFLRAKGIGTSIYYPRPVPMFTYYANKYGYSEKDFPAASWISDNSIAFPVGPHLDKNDMLYIARELKNAVTEVKKNG